MYTSERLQRYVSVQQRILILPTEFYSLLMVLSFCIYHVVSWQEWKYSTQTSDDWRDIWGFAEGPRGRRGHSMVVFDETKIVMFGGRDNEIQRPHVPKTYDLIEKEGTLEFSTYDSKPVKSNLDPSCKRNEVCVALTNATSGKNETCTYYWEEVNPDGEIIETKNRDEECGYVPVGLYYNDVWMYNVDCNRYADLECQDAGWQVLHPGAVAGDCRQENGTRVCKTPSERWGHDAAMFDDDTMLIYGGFSHECDDYCDDLWSFDLRNLEWKEIHPLNSEQTPGKRWKFSMTRGIDPISGNPSIMLYGGHRLWHGFASDNAEENSWQSNSIFDNGGYLGDLWTFVKNESPAKGEKNASTEHGTWVKHQGKESCVISPGISWDSRNDVECKIYWPKPRAGHVAIYDEEHQCMWIHGGFTAYFPYPSSSGPGSGYGITSQRSRDYRSYPTHPFYLDDLWLYNVTTGYWEEKKPFSLKNPSKRTDHIMILSTNILILFGGYADNHHYNDTWFYYIDDNKWLEKTSFVHADYHESCSDDLETIEQDRRCTLLHFPLPLKRSSENTMYLKYQEILPFKDQERYTPDRDYPLYFGIVDNAEEFVRELKKKYLEKEVYDKDDNRIWIESDIPDGTPIAPYAATAPRQYARLVRIPYMDRFKVNIWEWCTSVKAEPTRGRLVDGLFGRSNSSIFIPQPRRMSPGWDGCRGLKWKSPSSRSDHTATYIAKYNMLMFYGGVGYVDGPHDAASINETHKTEVLDDCWVFHVNNCVRNCSNHGVCTNGFCKCDPGYYSIDCSNYTCPGSECYYDENHEQHCTHCCHDGYNHTDDDVYVAGVRKLPCRKTEDGSFTGRSEGICDGFGTCQCAPPFIGEDCSIKDCKHNCSFNGYCSVEYPVSRCMCNPGYFGEYCQQKECLNNCTHPNGNCNFTTGSCECGAIYSPYYNNVTWSYWEGEDCSFLTPWCAASSMELSWFVVLMIVSTILFIMR